MSARRLILGATGFIGTALTRRLLGNGDGVQVLARRPAPWLASLGAEVTVGALGDADRLMPLLRACSEVVVLTADSTPASGLGAEEEFRRNLLPLAALIDRLGEVGPRPVLFLSSGGTVYGNPARLPVPESAPLAPVSLHGAGKVAAEALWAAHARRSAAPVTVLRPSNVFGPGQALNPHFGLVRHVIEHARRGTALTVRGDGSSQRDYLYIDDMVEACMACLGNRTEGVRTYNVGSGLGHSVMDVRDAVQRITGAPVRVRHEAGLASDVSHVVLDCARIAADLGWRPAIAFDDGIERSWRSP